MDTTTAEFYFNLADREKKGFIIKRDMQRLLQSEISFSPSQLESVFDLMDKQGNGYVTLEEFTKIFTTMKQSRRMEDPSAGSYYKELEVQTYYHAIPDLEKFTESILGNQDSITSVSQNAWENFLVRLNEDLTSRLQQEDNLEKIMKAKEKDNFNYVQSMMEEVENQIQTERKQIAEEEQKKAQKATARLANELEEKEKRLQLIAVKEHELKSQIAVIRGKNQSLSNLYEKLQREKVELEEELAEEKRKIEELEISRDECRQKLECQETVARFYHVDFSLFHSKLTLQARGLVEQLRMLFAMRAVLVSENR